MKNNFKDITGQRFGRLIVLKSTKQRKRGSIVWKCNCDCGKKIFVASRHLCGGNTKSCGCFTKDRMKELGKRQLGRKHPSWKGGRTTDGESGYIQINLPQPFHENERGQIREHIIIAEKALGKHLPTGAVVHHWGAKDDNFGGNLVICPNRAYHNFLHKRIREQQLF